MIYITARHMVGGTRHEHIASVKWRNPKTNKTGDNTRSEMVAWIRDEKGDARVRTGSTEAKVGVVKASPPYIRTHADGVWTDNLLALPTSRYFQKDTVDLVYLDPPFNSNATYNALFGEHGVRSAAQVTAFKDTWDWDTVAAATYQETVEQGGRVADSLRSFRTFLLGGGDSRRGSGMLAYLSMMAPRLVELRTVLKPTGSLWLHCDPTASHYLKMLLDSVFGPENFRNEVVWQRTAAKGDARRKFGSVHDLLLVYGKTRDTYFKPVARKGDEDYLARFDLDDDDGRGPYQSAPLDSPNPRPNLTYAYKGYQPPAKGWRVNLELMEQLDADGRLIFPPKATGRIRRKVYLSDQEGGGPNVTDVWTDIPPLQSRQRLGYPTEKPPALLERVIEASTKPGDFVLDPFCGLRYSR